jgi:hypothetical protein
MHGVIKKNLMNTSKPFYKKDCWVFFISALISIVFSFWLSVRESVINPDAICYLMSAAEMKSGLHAAMHLCSQAEWPFYSLLIYTLGGLTKLSLTNAAYLLDGIFSLISVVTFIGVIRFIKHTPRLLWLAAAVILLSHEFNSVRQYIVRDHGFWAFYLISIFLLLNYFRHYQWRYAVLWSMSLIVATLFRVEGAIFLLAMPFISFLDLRRGFVSRLAAFFQLNTITLLGAALLVIGLMTQPQIELTRLHEISFQLAHGVTTIAQHFATLKMSLAQHVLPIDSEHEAGSVLFLMMISWYFLSISMNLSLVYSVLVIYAWINRLFSTEKYIRLVIWGYILVNILITAGFLVEHMFLSKRYLLALSLALMIWVPFALNALLQQWSVRKWPAILAILFICISAVGGLFDFGYSKKYIYDAGNWLSVNAPQNALVYSNDYQVMYYSNHFGNRLFDTARGYMDMNSIAKDKWKQFDYIALRINKHDSIDKASWVNNISYPLAQTFENKRGDQVRIYRRKSL